MKAGKRFTQAICAVGALCCGTPECTELGAAIRDAGYAEVRPPSTLLPVGTVVAVSGHHPFSAKVICTAEDSLGAEFKPHVSPTQSVHLTSKHTKDIHLSANMMEQIKTDDRFAHIAGLSLSLTDPHIASLDDTQIRRHMRHRSVDCTRAIADRLERGYHVTIISSTLSGTIKYTANWSGESKVDASAKVSTLQQLAVSLGGEASSASEKTVTSQGLILGIVNDRYLASLSIEGIDENQHKEFPRLPFPGVVGTTLNTKGNALKLVAHDAASPLGMNRAVYGLPRSHPARRGASAPAMPYGHEDEGNRFRDSGIMATMASEELNDAMSLDRQSVTGNRREGR